VQDLAQKLLAAYALCEAPAMESMVDFDERDLLRFAERSGFPEVQIDAHFEVITYPEAAQSDPTRSDAALQNRSWDVFVRSSPNPLAPTLEEAMAATLTLPEVERFTSHLRPLVDSMQVVNRGEYVYLWAVKHGR
jgi:hypothetical protein